MNPPLKHIGIAFLGGALGSVARLLVGGIFDNVTTLIIVNLLGAAFLGYVNGSSKAGKRGFVSAGSKLFWGAGFAGGFTTMSGLAMGFVVLVANVAPALAAMYILGQLFFGLICYGSAYRAGSGEWPNA